MIFFSSGRIFLLYLTPLWDGLFLLLKTITNKTMQRVITRRTSNNKKMVWPSHDWGARKQCYQMVWYQIHEKKKKKNTYVEEVETSLAQPTLPISMQFQQRLQVKGYMLSKNVNCLQWINQNLSHTILKSNDACWKLIP